MKSTPIKMPVSSTQHQPIPPSLPPSPFRPKPCIKMPARSSIAAVLPAVLDSSDAQSKIRLSIPAADPSSITPVKMDIPQLTRHLLDGKSITLCTFESDKRGQEAFESSQLLAVCFKAGVPVETVRQDSFIRRYAFLLTHMMVGTRRASSRQLCALFRLDVPVWELSDWQHLQDRVCLTLRHLSPDVPPGAAEILYGDGSAAGYLIQDDPARILPAAVANRMATSILDQESAANRRLNLFSRCPA